MLTPCSCRATIACRRCIGSCSMWAGCNANPCSCKATAACRRGTALKQLVGWWPLAPCPLGQVVVPPCASNSAAAWQAMGPACVSLFSSTQLCCADRLRRQWLATLAYAQHKAPQSRLEFKHQCNCRSSSLRGMPGCCCSPSCPPARSPASQACGRPRCGVYRGQSPGQACMKVQVQPEVQAQGFPGVSKACSGRLGMYARMCARHVCQPCKNPFSGHALLHAWSDTCAHHGLQICSKTTSMHCPSARSGLHPLGCTCAKPR